MVFLVVLVVPLVLAVLAVSTRTDRMARVEAESNGVPPLVPHGVG